MTENNFAVTFTIQDDGPGIPAEELPHIFERFYKGKNSSKNSVGIGLSMARQLFLQQNGTIEAAIEAGKGTTSGFVLQRSLAVSFPVLFGVQCMYFRNMRLK